MLLLLLAIADFRFGISGGVPRHHVIVLDSSSVMGREDGAWMELARRRALAYLRAIPSGDRVLLVRPKACQRRRPLSRMIAPSCATPSRALAPAGRL